MKKNGFKQWDKTAFIVNAVYFGRLDCCKYLLSRGADANASAKLKIDFDKSAKKHILKRDNNNNFPILFVAAFNGDVEICKCLVSRGINVNASIENNWTALHIAALAGKLNVCKYLISQGADVNAKDKYGKTVLDAAAYSRNVELCKYLVLQDAKIDNEALFAAVYDGSLKTCKYLVSCGVDVNAKDEYGETVLHKAARGGKLKICKYLVSCGVDVNAKNVFGRTASDLAVAKGYTDIVNYLASNAKIEQQEIRKPKPKFLTAQEIRRTTSAHRVMTVAAKKEVNQTLKAKNFTGYKVATKKKVAISEKEVNQTDNSVRPADVVSKIAAECNAAEKATTKANAERRAALNAAKNVYYGSVAGGEKGILIPKEFQDYYAKLDAWIRPLWEEPSSSSLNGEKPSVTITLSIDDSGKVISSEITEPSGNAAMDASVRELVSRLKVAPKPPRAIHGITVSLNVR